MIVCHWLVINTPNTNLEGFARDGRRGYLKDTERYLHKIFSIDQNKYNFLLLWHIIHILQPKNYITFVIKIIFVYSGTSLCFVKFFLEARLRRMIVVVPVYQILTSLLCGVYIFYVPYVVLLWFGSSIYHDQSFSYIFILSDVVYVICIFYRVSKYAWWAMLWFIHMWKSFGQSFHVCLSFVMGYNKQSSYMLIAIDR